MSKKLTKNKETEDQLLESITKIDARKVLEKAKEKYGLRQSDQLVKLIEDNARLERALDFVRSHIKKVYDGDIFAIEDYLESRKKLERE